MSNPHLHKATVTVGAAIGRPYHAQCSCGTAGDFNLEVQAVGFVKGHFAKLGGIAETSLTIGEPKKKVTPVAAPAHDSAHVPGIGVMPASHAPGPKVTPPPPPPAPPSKGSK